MSRAFQRVRQREIYVYYRYKGIGQEWLGIVSGFYYLIDSVLKYEVVDCICFMFRNVVVGYI